MKILKSSLLAIFITILFSTSFFVSCNNTTKDTTENSTETWLSSSVPSLYETYKEYFDYIGIAAEYGNFGLSQTGSNKYTATYKANKYWGTPIELYYKEIQSGIKKHANSITLGNEMKPQFLLAWWNTGDGANQSMTDFTASNGQTIEVPKSLKNENLIYATLNVAKVMGVQMRGHVLTWHSQTPDDFFAEGYSAKSDDNFATLSNPVSKEVMTARHEWYIKTVLECVANWERENGYGTGNHIIWAWDVVNEATADDAKKTYTGNSQNWLRGSTNSTKNVAPTRGGSRWYQIYGDEEFIVNAFLFANAYAPTDVKLCYNDYNEYMNYSEGYKTDAICNLIDCVKNGSAKIINGNSVSPRIDVMAMQSHVGTSWPRLDEYETALRKFLEKEVDIHISELDFNATTQKDAATFYADYFKMLSKYGKKSSDSYKVENVTIWGINNENSWINPSNGVETYPLLFNLIDKVSNNGSYDEGESYAPNDSFWSVINALSSN